MRAREVLALACFYSLQGDVAADDAAERGCYDTPERCPKVQDRNRDETHEERDQSESQVVQELRRLGSCSRPTSADGLHGSPDHIATENGQGSKCDPGWGP